MKVFAGPTIWLSSPDLEVGVGVVPSCCTVVSWGDKFGVEKGPYHPGLEDVHVGVAEAGKGMYKRPEPGELAIGPSPNPIRNRDLMYDCSQT
jgi:hypothetical protein